MPARYNRPLVGIMAPPLLLHGRMLAMLWHLVPGDHQPQSEAVVAGNVAMVQGSPLGYRRRPGLAFDGEHLCSVARQRNRQLADGTAAMGQRGC